MMQVKVAHISMQSTDTAAQQRADTARIFTRAKEHGYAWITGTEANTPWISDIFRAAAHNGGYVYAHGGDVWVAVAGERIQGVPIIQWNGVIDGHGGDKEGPHFPNRGVLRVSYKDKELGSVTVLASHFQTKRTSKVRPADNRLLAERIETLARRHGEGAALCFYGGDQNITDRTGDTFKGGPLTSCWDELGKWPNTGHDNIDVIASYDGDRRVSCVSARALPDKIFGLNTDHFLIEATYDVAPTIGAVPPAHPPKDTQPVSTAPKKFKPPAPTVVGGKPAKHSGHGNKPPTRVVIHSAVMPCERGRARQLAKMNTEGLGGGSWHYAVDPYETIQCSYDSFVCWHAPPNNHSIGIEMADDPKPWPSGSHTKAWWAKLTKSWRWRTPEHAKMLVRTAQLTAELCLGYNLPIVFLSPKDLRAGKRGITIHANVSKAFGQSTHWDPGAWPRFRFMRLVRAHAKKLREA